MAVCGTRQALGSLPGREAQRCAACLRGATVDYLFEVESYQAGSWHIEICILQSGG